MLGSIRRLAARIGSTWTESKPQHLDTIERPILDATTGAAHTLRIEADQHGATIDVDGRSIILDVAHGQLCVFPVNEFGDITEAAALSIPVATEGRILTPAGWTHV